jgi:hypothetical protein
MVEEKLKWSYIQVQLCKFRDKRKSIPFTDEKGRLLNPKGLTYCNNEKRWVTPTDPCKCHERKDITEYIVNCKKCKRVLARYSVINGEKGEADGIVGFRYTQHLLAYRLRSDKLIGLECVCGNSDTRLSTKEKIAKPNSFPSLVRSSNKNEADFGSKGKYFETISLKVN